jgi:fructose-1-phosphate kinase PfkB-like protein
MGHHPIRPLTRPVAWRQLYEQAAQPLRALGVASGTAAAMREGVGVGTRAEVEALHEQVRLDQMKGD